jgi:hypothetical protein
MSRTDPSLQIAISYEENIPEEIISHFVSKVVTPGLDVKTEVREPSPQANLEWLIPTAVIIFIGKAYFDSFLKEMGKDHYHLLKKGILSLWKYFFGHDRTINYKRVYTGGKISSARQYSLALSLMTDIFGEYRIKYLFKDDLSATDFEKAITEFLNFLEELDAGILKLEIRQQLENYRAVGRTVLLTYEDGQLKVLNPLPSQKAEDGT